MKNWESVLVAPETTLREALQRIDRASSQIALVVDGERRLLGTLSDGDVRRALLGGLSLVDPVSSAMFAQPTKARVSDSSNAILALMRRRGLHQVPLVDDRDVVRGLALLDDYLAVSGSAVAVVIMAGGLGSRLDELTRHTPKPMLKVGSRPLLETIVRGFAEQGFRKFHLAVNYKADQIEAHFGDGSEFGVEIGYLRERERLGTAGALSLLPERPAQPLIVTNADLLTRMDYARMIECHAESGALATMAVRDYEIQVPFGVISEEAGRILAIEEKPVHRFTVSAGMYVLAPDALDHVPARKFFDMPSLFSRLIDQGLPTHCFPIDGYWLDIGRRQDYERANHDFADVFPDGTDKPD
jgi:dTDP-glucose pyrophosphorylase